jgi:long-chain fatty acid transport protein
VSAGAEYEFIKGLQGRLGFVWDPTGSPSLTLTPDLPDATRYKFTVGLGWRASFGLRIDAAYQYVLLAPATSTAPGFTGTYSGSASVISLNVGYRL